MARFGLEPGEPAWERRYKLAPREDILEVLQEGGGHRLALMRWGLVPPWAASPDQGYKMINSRG